MIFDLSRQKREIQLVSAAHRKRFAPPAPVRIERIHEFTHAFIGWGSGHAGERSSDSHSTLPLASYPYLQSFSKLKACVASDRARGRQPDEASRDLRSSAWLEHAASGRPLDFFKQVTRLRKLGKGVGASALPFRAKENRGFNP